MQNNNTRTKTAFMRFVAVSLITAVVSGCGADTSDTETQTGSVFHPVVAS
jgi:hypothetical protein